jgi:hypothetical protein
MVFITTFNNISVILWRSVYWWRKPEYPEKSTDLSQVTVTDFHSPCLLAKTTGHHYDISLHLSWLRPNQSVHITTFLATWLTVCIPAFVIHLYDTSVMTSHNAHYQSIGKINNLSIWQYVNQGSNSIATKTAMVTYAYGRRVWRYQWGYQNPYVEGEQTT